MADNRSGGRTQATFSILNVLPLLAFPLIVYVLVTLANGGNGNWVNGEAVTFQLMSGDLWLVTVGDLFVALGLFLLFIEIIKSTQTGASSIINHGLSMALTLICVLMFVTTKGYGTAEFFFLTLMQVLDVVAGFTITIAGARRDFGTTVGPGGPN